MSIPLEASLVRIFAADGSVVGTGFLVGEMTVLTCAHVIATALGVAADIPKAPELTISLDFPLLASGRRLSAQVILWQPIQADDSGDIALLQLKHAPPEAEVARLVIAEDLWEHPFRAFGFPDNHDQGVWASGRLRAREATGWIQIEDIKTTGKGVQRGFSGGAVWDEQLEGIAGMIVAADEDTSKVAYMIPTKVLIQAWPRLGQQAIPPCPYRGLFAFREQDAAYFFGRETFIQQLVEAIRTKPLVAVVGSSGSGKSSVVFAGLLPRLHREGNWLITSLRPGHRPFRNLAATLIPLLEPKMSETDRLVEIKKLADQLEQGRVILQDVVDRLQQLSPVAHLLLVVDQFEELYTLCQKEEEYQYFLETLLTAVSTNSHHASRDFHLLLTLRADFFGHALSYRPFADALQNADVKLGPMTRQELRDAIQNPAEKLHVQIEDGLTERLLDGVGSAPGNLPLLEFALSLLWTRQRAGTLTHAAYDKIGGVEHDKIGGVEQALALYAEEIYGRLEEEEQKQVPLIFTQLVQPGVGTEDVRRLATRAEIGEERWDVVIRLSDARLVVTGRNEATRQETVEVVHEALIRAWERLRLWIEANREFRLWQERLRTVMRQWDLSRREKDLLLRGNPLGEAEGWLTRPPDDLSEEERTFIKASIAEKQRQEQEERERKELEFALRRRATNRQRLLIGLIVVMLLVAILAPLIARARFQILLASVTNLNSNGPGSLRQAMETASPNSTITFAAGLSGTITLSDNNFGITIDKNLIISGPGPSVLSISGGNSYRVFSIAPKASVTISGLTIKRGQIDLQHSGEREVGGSSIYNNGALELQDCIISGNIFDLPNTGTGGTIFNDGGGVLSIVDSVITGNRIDGSNMVPSSGEDLVAEHSGGGGLYNLGTAILAHSTITNNTVNYGKGGGIFNEGTLTINNSQITSNTMSYNKGAGGGIFNMGTLNIHDSTIADNVVSNSGDGGGIYNEGTLVIWTSTLSSNRVKHGNGGGIYTDATFSFYDCTISGNTVTNGSAGGIAVARATSKLGISISYCTIYNNTASIGGGMVISDQNSSSVGEVTMEYSILAGNHASRNQDITGLLFASGHNLIEDETGATIHVILGKDAALPLTGVSPKLGPLRNNGGPTQTHAVLPGSPVIGLAPCGLPIDYRTDQRGFWNVSPSSFGNDCTIGSYQPQ